MSMTMLLRLMTSVGLFILFARQWSVPEFGEFMYWFTVSSVVVILVDFGLSQSLLRNIGQNPANAGTELRAVLEGKTLLTFAVILGSIAYCVIAGKNPPQGLLFLILILTGIINSFAEAMNATYRGLGLFQAETKIVFFSNIIYVCLVAACLYFFETTLAVALGMLFSRVVYFLISTSIFKVAPCNEIYEASIPRAFRYVKKHFTFGLDAFLTNFYSSIDTILVQHYLGSGAVGIYQAGSRLMQGGNTFAQVLSNVYIPKIAGSQRNGPKLFANMKILLCYLMIVGGIFSLLFTWVPASITVLVYGDRYTDLKNLLPFFGVLLFIRYIAAAYGVGLAGLGLQSSRVCGILGALTVFLMFSFVLIGHFKLYGLLAALIASTVFLMIYYERALSYAGFRIKIGISNKLLMGTVLALLGTGSWLTWPSALNY